MNRSCVISVVFFLGVIGCTSYQPGSTTNEKIVQRYEQNIILESDSTGIVVKKSIKHTLVDLVSLCFAEIWYSRVEDTYAHLMRRIEAARRAEKAWLEFRRNHLGLTANQIIVKFGRPDIQSSDGAGGKLLIYEDSMRKNQTFISLVHSMYGSGHVDIEGYNTSYGSSASGSSYFSGSGYTSGHIDSSGFAQIERVWFAVGPDHKVYGVNRREAKQAW